MIPWPEPPQDLSTEVSRAKAAKPDIIAPITRPASAQLLLPEILLAREVLLRLKQLRLRRFNRLLELIDRGLSGLK